MQISGLEIDFSELMDLRVDYAFKLFFATEDTSRLISLLNAIYANKGIPRVINTLTIVNPAMEKADELDKLSILDMELFNNKLRKIAAGFLSSGGAGKPQECLLPFKVLPRRVAAKRLGKTCKLFIGSSLGAVWGHDYTRERQD